MIRSATVLSGLISVGLLRRLHCGILGEVIGDKGEGGGCRQVSVSCHLTLWVRLWVLEPDGLGLKSEPTAFRLRHFRKLKPLCLVGTIH